MTNVFDKMIKEIDCQEIFEKYRGIAYGFEWVLHLDWKNDYSTNRKRIKIIASIQLNQNNGNLEFLKAQVKIIETMGLQHYYFSSHSVIKGFLAAVRLANKELALLDEPGKP